MPPTRGPAWSTVDQQPERHSDARRASGPTRGSRRVLPLLVGALALLLAVAWATGGLEYAAWWATNTAPPSVALAGPSGAVRGAATVGVRVEPSGRARAVEAQVDGRSIAAGDPLVVDTTALPDGDHQVAVVAEDDSWRRNRSTAALSLRSDNTPPRVALEGRPEQVPQGHTWLLRLRADEPAAITATLAGRPLDLQVGDGFGWAVVGFGPAADPGTLPLAVDATDQVGNRADQQVPVPVVPGEFPLDRVEVPSSLLPLLGPEIRAEEDRRLAANYARVTRPRLWEGRFLLPVQGAVITEFGTLRTYNGGPVVGHHNGVDLAAPAGQPVRAPNRGRLVLIDQLPLRGRVAILDHGLGVFTTYAHLSAVDTPIGEVVERGQPFARVGSSGLSTGPHLHWELWVGGANVEPLEWTERDLP